MTQLEVAIKYDIPQCDVSNACRGIFPPEDGNWDTPEVAKAVYAFYEAKAKRHRQKAREYTAKAVRIYLGGIEKR